MWHPSRLVFTAVLEGRCWLPSTHGTLVFGAQYLAQAVQRLSGLEVELGLEPRSAWQHYNLSCIFCPSKWGTATIKQGAKVKKNFFHVKYRTNLLTIPITLATHFGNNQMFYIVRWRASERPDSGHSCPSPRYLRYLCCLFFILCQSKPLVLSNAPRLIT